MSAGLVPRGGLRVPQPPAPPADRCWTRCARFGRPSWWLRAWSASPTPPATSERAAGTLGCPRGLLPGLALGCPRASPPSFLDAHTTPATPHPAAGSSSSSTPPRTRAGSLYFLACRGCSTTTCSSHLQPTHSLWPRTRACRWGWPVEGCLAA